MTKQTQPLEIVAEIPPGIDLPPPKVVGEFRKLGTDALNGANKALGIYRELVAFIRENQLQPGYVRPVLRHIGWKDDGISRIIRVADSPAEDYKKFAAGELSFKAALHLTRGSNLSSGAKEEIARLRAEANAAKPRNTEREQLKYDLLGVLESYLPVVSLPGKRSRLEGLTVKINVHGYPVEVKIGRKVKGGDK